MNDVNRVSSDINIDAVGKRDYRAVPFNQGTGSTFELGSGIDMSNPIRPIARGKPFGSIGDKSTTEGEKAVDGNDFIANASYRIVEGLTVLTEYKMLYAYFGGSYSGIEGDASYSDVQERTRTHKTIYAIIEQAHSGPAITSPLNWGDTPISESIADDDARRRQFLDDFGSHYIQSLTYGIRIAVRGEVLTDDQKRVQRFSANFKAAFGSDGVEGGITTQQRQELLQDATEIRATVVGGTIDPPGSYVLIGYDAIKAFLDGVKAGTITLHMGVVSANLQSFHHTLTNYPRTQSCLAGSTGQVAQAPFGVPAGTIIAWSPRIDPGRSLEGGKDQPSLRRDLRDGLSVPEGWQICDGQFGTPDLRDRFLRGAASPDLQFGGADSHVHNGKTKEADAYFEAHNIHSHGTRASRKEHQHELTIEPSAHVPAFYTVVYLMKV